MKNVDLYGRVRHAVLIDGMSSREAARVFGVDPRTIAKMLAFSFPPGYRRSQPVRRPKLDAFTGIIDQTLEADKLVPKKQRHTSKRIFERLRDEHDFEGGITIVKDYIFAAKQRQREMFVPLSHPPGQQPHHHRQVSGTDGACGAGMWFWHRGSPVSGMSPICATFHLSCQSCKTTQTAESVQTARTAENAQTAKPAPWSGRRKASLRDQNPGSEKKRGSGPAKKPAPNHPAFRMGLPRYRPQSAPRLAAAVRAFLTSARTCQTQSRRRRKALVCSPGDPLGRVPEPCRGRASQTAVARAVPYIWAGNPGNDFGGLSVAKSSKNQ